MIKQDLYDNTSDSFLAIEAKKQQIAFFPKEESQMVQSKNFNYVAPSSDSNSDNTDEIAFLQRTTNSYLPVNSSHTATDYIGAITISVPYTILDNFASYKFYDMTKDVTKDLYDSTDSVLKLKSIVNGLQTLRVPKNIFNEVLLPENTVAIAANGGSTLIKNYGYYYITIKPKYVETNISSIIKKEHITWANMPANDNSGVPDKKRRNIIECDKTDFLGTSWSFENNSEQSGRLYGSVVEIWDAAGTSLKQVKVMNENIFNFDDIGAMQIVLSPDNMGYDPSTQNPAVGDILRVYPRETFFDEIIIEINYKDKYLQVENMISFMINDVARDMQTGSYQVYDDKGLKVEDTGVITGNVVHRYQIVATDRFEIRKRIKE